MFLLGAVHKRRRQLVGRGRGAKISQNCRRIVLKNCRYGRGGCQKSGKVVDIVYEWSLSPISLDISEFSIYKRKIILPHCERHWKEKKILDFVATLLETLMIFLELSPSTYRECHWSLLLSRYEKFKSKYVLNEKSKDQMKSIDLV